MYELFIWIGTTSHKVECVDLVHARMLWDFIHAQETKPQVQKLVVDGFVTNQQRRP